MKIFYSLALSFLMVSCVQPDKQVEEEVKIPPKPPSQAPVLPEEKPVALPLQNIPQQPDDGLRIPDMLTLPNDDILRPNTAPASNSNAPIIARPPQD